MQKVDSRPRQAVDRADCKIRIFKKSQQRKADHRRDDQCRLGSSQFSLAFHPVHHNAAGVGHQNRGEHQKNIDWLTPCVKHKAEQQQNQVSEFFRN